MSRSVLVAWFLLTAALAPEARAQDGTVTINGGGVSVTASADTRCDDPPPTGAVQAPFDGDSTAPYSSSVTADVSVPCAHGQAPHQHSARGDASATGDAVSGPDAAVISASGTVAATVVHAHAAGAFAEFNQEFSIEGAPVSYRLTAAGLVQLDGGLTGSTTGTLQPGGHTIRGFADCSADSGRDCAGRGFSLTLELDVAADSDGDGLLDSWETDGTPDGLDLPAMGADALHKDIFLEVDHMTGHALSQTAVDRVVAAFAAAPVGNPDGDGGITLHVDNGPASRMDPTTGAAWGADSDADELPHQPVLGSLNGNSYDWSAFDAVKASNFQPERADAFHYLVSGHRYGSPTEDSSGISRGFGASDLIVTLGPVFEPAESSGTVEQQAGTIMHELGHNLGLRHGGDDDGNYEPNRLSIMNYAFQFTGLPRVDGTRVLDYARLAVDLDERALSESRGFGLAAGTEPAAWLTLFQCPDGALQWAFLQASRTDWNCNGAFGGVIARDLNGDAVETALVPFLDWPALVYDGGAIGDAGAALPAESELIEPPLQELLAAADEVEQAQVQARPRPAPPQPGGGGGGAAADDPPVLSGLRLSPSAFRAGRPASVHFTASARGFVRFTVKRVLPGRRAGRRCVAPRRGKGRRCT
ncbi:MAG TPA: hypothetical protein VFM58_14915, partial [Solirubrobacteraceae bacterium]|nr:hypothetical protein [Solirubrobacteraceae bacterium]